MKSVFCLSEESKNFRRKFSNYGIYSFTNKEFRNFFYTLFLCRIDSSQEQCERNVRMTQQINFMTKRGVNDRKF